MGPGDGSIPSCHGDTGCILRQARASLVRYCTDVPPLPRPSLLAAVPGVCRVVLGFWRCTLGTERWDSAR